MVVTKVGLNLVCGLLRDALRWEDTFCCIFIYPVTVYNSTFYIYIYKYTIARMLRSPILRRFVF